MRDDQVRTLVTAELVHAGNLCLLRNQQVKIMLDSIISALSEPWLLLRCLFQPHKFRIRVDEIYVIKTRSFNDQMKEAVIKEKLKT